ncbi:MAG: tryptophanyl-tRNA synthetase [Candidatus Xenolissoclinum pacificiensis L6]|uniref:Tryptophan--tRNA ligase n=1 Tax=Candidatus Xenolissoclinum pacificiensis L6 TaxID=1401685 RepID=W2V141_9RICK|nr:MAG: tryptophanyl-tRNA synthetase [Candidatus Xenolissoclinum pacificiensis L6]
MTNKIVFSGIQPTGSLHVGNYFGSIKNWLSFQDDDACDLIVSVVDWHAISVLPFPSVDDSLFTVASYIASGISPEQSSIILQSSIQEHTELQWVLSIITKLGWLNRMTQYKDKSSKHDNNALGLYAYPVLMASDVLLYDTDIVPVGMDQVQHVELIRTIAKSFNQTVNKQIFKIPELSLNEQTMKIKSLSDATKKMSKSDASDKGRINLTDSNDLISSKIMSAKTLSVPNTTVFDYHVIKSNPELNNLVVLYSACTGLSTEEASSLFKSCSQFKKLLVEVLVDLISPIREKINHLMNDKKYLISVLQNGKAKVLPQVQKKMDDIKELIGIMKLYQTLDN